MLSDLLVFGVLLARELALLVVEAFEEFVVGDPYSVLFTLSVRTVAYKRYFFVQVLAVEGTRKLLLGQRVHLSLLFDSVTLG